MDLKPRENPRYYVLKAEYCSLRYFLGIPEILHGFKTWGKSAKLRIESLIVWDTRIQRYMHELKTSGKSEILPFVQKFILWSTIQFVQGIRIQNQDSSHLHLIAKAMFHYCIKWITFFTWLRCCQSCLKVWRRTRRSRLHRWWRLQEKK